MSLFSVIVPAFNSKRYIRDCVTSVISQSFGDFELVVVDDGSTDGTAKLVVELAAEDSRIRLVSKSNGGVSSARNTGLNEARGRYVVFLDSDDEMAAGALDAYAAVIERCSPDVVQGIASRIDAKGREVSRIAVTSRMTSTATACEAVEALALEDKAPLLHYIWNKAYSRALLDRAQARFDESVSLGEDFIFNCTAMTAAGPVAFIAADVCRYIQREPESLTRCFRSDELLRRRKMEGSFRDLLEAFGQWEVKEPLYNKSVGAITLESLKSVALPGCVLSASEKQSFVRSFYESEYRSLVEAFVESGECTRSNRLFGRIFLSGRLGLFVFTCVLVSKLKKSS